MANGWVPAAPMASPLVAAVWITWRRSERSCSPASAVFPHGWVEISSTDSISSGLISPVVAGSSSDSIALTSSSDWPSRIISSSSIPIVYAGPVKRWSTRRSLTVAVLVDWAAATRNEARAGHRHPKSGGSDGSWVRRQAVHPRVRPSGVLPEEDVRDRERPYPRGDREDLVLQTADLR